MNFLTKPLCIFLISLLFAACTGEQHAQTDQITQSSDSTLTNPSSEQKSVSGVVEGYLQLKDALVASSAATAKEKAVEMLEAIDATFMPAIQQNIKTIASTDDLEEQRIYFDSLSMNLYQNIQKTNGNRQTLYKQFCPMAFNNRGAFWLSNTEEIRNPYFGNDMLTCGKTEEVLEPETLQ